MDSVVDSEVSTVDSFVDSGMDSVVDWKMDSGMDSVVDDGKRLRQKRLELQRRAKLKRMGVWGKQPGGLGISVTCLTITSPLHAENH